MPDGPLTAPSSVHRRNVRWLNTVCWWRQCWLVKNLWRRQDARYFLVGGPLMTLWQQQILLAGSCLGSWASILGDEGTRPPHFDWWGHYTKCGPTFGKREMLIVAHFWMSVTNAVPQFRWVTYVWVSLLIAPLNIHGPSQGILRDEFRC